jgi:hypothetical protein
MDNINYHVIMSERQRYLFELGLKAFMKQNAGNPYADVDDLVEVQDLLDMIADPTEPLVPAGINDLSTHW